MIEDKLGFAVAAVREAGASTLAHFRSPSLAVELKDNRTPVTAADREAERLLRERIGAAYPEDGILGEEEGETPGESGHVWILDPIDGTKSFVHGVPLFGTMLALEVEGRAVLGAICFPALGELVYAAEGKGAHWITGIGGEETRRPARVSSVDRLADAALSFTSMSGFCRLGLADVLERLRAATGLDRGWGDCYGHVLVATGRAEVMVDPQLAVWDAAPLLPIVREAGGVYRDLDGRVTHRGRGGISTNAALADAVFAVLRGKDPGA